MKKSLLFLLTLLLTCSMSMWGASTPSFAAFKFGTNDVIKTDKINYSDGWVWDAADFIRVRAYNTTDRTTNNYITMFFWTNTFDLKYNGMMGPKTGTYTVYNPQFPYSDGWDLYPYWYLTDEAADWDNTVVGYGKDVTYGYGECMVGSYAADVTASGVSSNLQGFKTVKVATGKDGNIYIRVYKSDGSLFVTIGEPQQFTVSVSSSDTNLGTVSGGGTVEEGQSMTVTATKKSGYNFDGWYENNVRVSTDATYTISNITANHTLVAQFSSVQYQITGSAAVGYESMGGVTGSGLYGANTTATLTAVPNPTYKFVQWNDGNTQNPRSFTVTGPQTYTATFTQYEHVIDINVRNCDLDASVSGIKQFYGVVGDYYWAFCYQSTTLNGTYSWYTDGEYADWNWLNIGSHAGNDQVVNISFATATIRSATNGNSGDIYMYDEENSTCYHFIMAYRTDATFGDDYSYEDACDYTPSWDQCTVTKGQLSYNGKYKYSIAYTLNSTHVEQMGIDVVVGDDIAYIPTGVYPINDDLTNGTIVASIGSDDGSYPSYGYYWGKSSGTVYWFWRYGKSLIINPNQTLKPMYFEAKGGNTWFSTVDTHIGTKPALRQVTLANASNGNTATMASKEGHGYPEGGVEAGMEGDYYYQGTKLTLTATPATGYRFVRWKNGNTQLSTDATYEYTVGSSNATITPEFELQKFTVTIAKDPSDYGTVSQTSVANVPYGTVITTDNDKVTINGTTVTATPATATAQYTYALDSWTNGTATVTEATTVTANFSRTTNKYTVTINTPEHGTLTVKNNETLIASGTKVDYGTTLTVTYQADGGYHFDAWTNNGAASVTIDGDKTIGVTFAPNVHTLTWAGIDGATLSGDYTAAGDVAYGTTLVAPEVEKAGFNFLGWDPTFVESTTMPDNDVTYTAQWEEAATFTLEDQHNAGEAYYTSLAGFVGSTKDVTYQRTLGGGTVDAPCWSTFSLPFDYPLYGNDRTFQDKVVYLDHASYDAGSGILTLNFMYETYKIEANKPYALYNTGDAIVNPVFENVEIAEQTDGSYTVDCTTGGSVTFTNTQTRQKLNANDPNTIYVAGQALRYPGAATYMRAFSGYFVLNDVYSSANIAPRVRVVINEEDATAIMSEDAPAKVETKKYMENGILVIERAGIRYTAQGTCLR